MKLASALRGSVALTSAAVLLSIGCGGDFRSASSDRDGGVGSGGRSAGGKSGAGASNGGNAGSNDDSGAGGDAAGGTSAGGASANGGTGGRPHGSGGRAGSGNGGAQTGGDTGTGGTGTGGSGNGGVVGSGGSAGAGAGGRDTSQHASDYDQSCSYDGQCSLVNDTSDACSCKTCPNDAISSSALAKWNADRKAFNCPPVACPQLLCQEMLSACAKGTCTARKPFVVDASNYDHTCTQNSDCTTIPVGEICSPCQCAVGAVNKTGLQQYQNDRAKVLCTPGPIACGCAPQIGGVVCSPSPTGGTGTCVISSVATTN